MGCVLTILRRHTTPALTPDRNGSELAHSRDPGFVVAAVCLRVCRQASRYIVFLVAFASTMTCLSLELSLDTDGAIHLIFVSLHVTSQATV